MKIERNIKKEVIRNVKYELDNIDWDALMPSEKELKEKANTVVEVTIKDEIAKHIYEKIIKKLQKEYPLIDAWINDQVVSILHKVKQI